MSGGQLPPRLRSAKVSRRQLTAATALQVSRRQLTGATALQASSLGKESTARDVIEFFQPDLAGKTCLLTGGNTGVGLEAAKALAARGCRVVLTTRDKKATEAQILQEIRSEGLGGYAVPTADVSILELELSDFASIERLAEDFLAQEQRLDFLVLNAGVGGVRGKVTKQGFEWQMGVNHFGHVRLTQLLLPKMKAQPFTSRVVTLSSMAHASGKIDPGDLMCSKNDLWGYGSYAHSKLANLLFARGLHARLKAEGKTNVVSCALHPGVVPTRLWRHFPWLLRKTLVAKILDRDIPQGAATTVYACVAPELGVFETGGGKYLNDCAFADSSPAGSDASLQDALWEETERQIAGVLVGRGAAVPSS